MLGLNRLDLSFWADLGVSVLIVSWSVNDVLVSETVSAMGLWVQILILPFSGIAVYHPFILEIDLSTCPGPEILSSGRRRGDVGR
jgi:hypothetical protein